MTESEWLGSNDPSGMFAHVRGQARSRRVSLPHRRLRLFGCACCRLAWELLADEPSRAAVEASERFADGLAKKSELARAHRAAAVIAVALKLPDEPLGLVGEGRHPPQLAAEMAAWASTDSIHDVVEMTALTADNLATALEQRPLSGGTGSVLVELRRLGRVFRDVFGNPFRPVSVEPAWLTPTVVALAQTVYADRLPAGELDRDRLLVLADALEEAGAAEELLDHLRSVGPHVRGCFVVDALLGKE